MTLSADNIDSEYFMEKWRWTSEMRSVTHMWGGSRALKSCRRGTLSSRLDFLANFQG